MVFARAPKRVRALSPVAVRPLLVLLVPLAMAVLLGS